MMTKRGVTEFVTYEKDDQVHFLCPLECLDVSSLLLLFSAFLGSFTSYHLSSLVLASLASTGFVVSKKNL